MVCILLANGFEEAEALVPADLMRRAGIEVALTGAQGSKTVTGAHGIVIQADCLAEELDPETLEMVVVPGGLGGVRGLARSKIAGTFLRYAYEHELWLCAICAGPTLLASLGLLNGRNAVCYPGMEQQLYGAYPCPGNSVISDGKLITGEGPGAAFDFGLKLVEALKGAEAARKVKSDACIRH